MKLKKKENDSILIFNNLLKNNNIIRPSNISLEDWNQLLELYYNEKKIELNNELIIENDKIKYWSSKNNIDKDIMINFFKIFENKKKILKDLKLIIDNIYTISDEEKIIRPFIYGYPNNIDDFLFYLKEKDEDENKRSIINTIKIEWLIKNNSNNIIIQNKFNNRYIR